MKWLRTGSPFRPLYDDKIMFNGQPIALVVAETSEIARFAASLVRVDYEKEPHATDIFRQRDAAVPVRLRQIRPKPCSRRRKRAARPTRRWRPPRCATRPNILFRSSITTRWSSMPRRRSSRDDGKLTVYDKTQGVQNVQQYLCGVFGMKPEDVRVMSPFHGRRLRLRPASAISGGAGGACGARAAALGARRADASSRCMRWATGRR